MEWIEYRWPEKLQSFTVGALTFTRQGETLSLLPYQVEQCEKQLLAAGFERVAE